MKQIPVFVFGAGGVGRALLRQILATREIVASRNHCHFDIISIMDSSSWLSKPAGLSDSQLLQAIHAKENGLPLGEERQEAKEALAQLVMKRPDNGLVVDVTAEDGMEPLVDQALEIGFGVVLANKKPLAGPWNSARHYFNHPQIRYEATVGAGQPVIATLRYLRDTGDEIYQIEGQLSGTLGYICGRLDEGISFSMALAEAKANGYTEPDPREDLGGMDVMRKILILGRLAGWPLEASDIEIEALYHSSLAHLSIGEFMDAAIAMDPSIRDRVDNAAVDGSVLRFVAQVSGGGGSVGLKAIAKGSPLAGLKYIAFHTGHYEDEPLMIAGKGAGVEITAAGVLGDMISLVRESLS